MTKSELSSGSSPRVSLGLTPEPLAPEDEIAWRAQKLALAVRRERLAPEYVSLECASLLDGGCQPSVANPLKDLAASARLWDLAADHLWKASQVTLLQPLLRRSGALIREAAKSSQDRQRMVAEAGEAFPARTQRTLKAELALMVSPETDYLRKSSGPTVPQLLLRRTKSPRATGKHRDKTDDSVEGSEQWDSHEMKQARERHDKAIPAMRLHEDDHHMRPAIEPEVRDAGPARLAHRDDLRMLLARFKALGFDLREEERRALSLCSQGYSFREIGVEVWRSASTGKSRMNALVRRLRGAIPGSKMG